MFTLITEFGWLTIFAATLIMTFAGFTKGAIGFALPMISISGIGSIMPVEIAIAALILPGLATNIWQSLRQGLGEAWISLRKYWRLNLTLFFAIYGFAQLVVMIPDRWLFIILGVGITTFGTILIIGWRPTLSPKIANRIEPLVGVIAGFFGGLSGVWGPPILLFLLATDTPKVEMVRVQGISFLIGAIVLLGAHLQSGLLNAVTLPFSAFMVIPAMIGMAVGFGIQDRLEQQRFRRVTLYVLVFAGLNLLRRGLFG